MWMVFGLDQAGRNRQDSTAAPVMSLKSLLLTVALCCVSGLFAQANLIDCGVDLGVLSPYGGSVTYTDGSGAHTVTHTGGWAAFTLGDMVDRDDLSGSSMITGDVGVGG